MGEKLFSYYYFHTHIHRHPSLFFLFDLLVNMGDAEQQQQQKQQQQQRDLDLIEMHASALRAGASRLDADRQAKLAAIEASIQGTKRVSSFSPEATKTFSEFVNASLLAIKSTPPPTNAWPMANQAASVFLAVTGRSHVLSRSRPEGVASGPTTVPAAVHADDITEGVKGIPRPPPGAAPVGIGNGIPERLDLRALSMSSYAINMAVYHAQRAIQQQKSQTSRAAGLYNPEICGPQDKYVCSMEHVAWSLTEPYGPFKPCAERDMCAGRTLMTIPEAHRVTLKMYVSPHVRAEYERTGVLPSTDEFNRRHMEQCIICYLKTVAAISEVMVVTNQTSAPVFPDFYNPTGSRNTYHDSALTCFSTLSPTGSVLGYRNFLPDQLVASNSIYVVQTTKDPVGGHAVSQLIRVRGLRERIDLVGWRPKIECDATKTVYLHEPPPSPQLSAAASTRPPHAPNSSEASPSGITLIQAPPEIADAAETLRKARASVDHMLPRTPTPTLITFNKVLGVAPDPAASDAVADSPRLQTRAGARKRQAPEDQENSTLRNVAVKREPIEEPSTPAATELDVLLARMRSVTSQPLMPKN